MPMISHRGAAHLDQANSSKAVQTGDKFQPDFIEVDINCTADGKLVIHHGYPTRFLRGVRMKEDFLEIKSKIKDIMLLDEFLNITTKSPIIYDIKVKEAGLLSSIIRVLSTSGRHDFAFTSPHWEALVAMQDAFPGSYIFQSQPYHHGPIAALELARRHNFNGIALNKWWLTPLVYKLCKIHSKKIMVYTIDSRLWLKIAGKLFPDVYIVTNRPNVYRQLFPR